MWWSGAAAAQVRPPRELGWYWGWAVAGPVSPAAQPPARPARPLKHRTGDKNHSHTPAKMFLFGEKNTIRRKTSDNKMVVGNTDRHNLKRLGLQTAFTFSI